MLRVSRRMVKTDRVKKRNFPSPGWEIVVVWRFGRNRKLMNCKLLASQLSEKHHTLLHTVRVHKPAAAGFFINEIVAGTLGIIKGEGKRRNEKLRHFSLPVNVRKMFWKARGWK